MIQWLAHAQSTIIFTERFIIAACLSYKGPARHLQYTHGYNSSNSVLINDLSRCGSNSKYENIYPSQLALLYLPLMEIGIANIPHSSHLSLFFYCHPFWAPRKYCRKKVLCDFVIFGCQLQDADGNFH